MKKQQTSKKIPQEFNSSQENISENVDESSEYGDEYETHSNGS